jgi:hypothetical protein
MSRRNNVVFLYAQNPKQKEDCSVGGKISLRKGRRAVVTRRALFVSTNNNSDKTTKRWRRGNKHQT